ncbi:MAG: hypothetical protein A4E23_01644 [Methanomethylovorans sp. PtaU1.Bin073]|jgi:hypothetical protein|nr:MAG: hypothetical protein A4E23_01644 [Methanomethylovorans sp. PtaU1.Bin073]
MYIMIEDPENPSRRLYADLTYMTETTEDYTTSVIGIEVNDVVCEDDLACSIAADLRNVKINDKVVLTWILKEHYRIFHIHSELIEAIQGAQQGVNLVPAPTECVECGVRSVFVEAGLCRQCRERG